MSGKVEGKARIFLAMEDGCLPKSIKQVLAVGMDGRTHEFVESHKDADLVIMTDVRAVAKDYSPEKLYAYIAITKYEANLLENCCVIDSSNMLEGLVIAINKARQRIIASVEKRSESANQTDPEPGNDLWVLVVDDSKANINSAIDDLSKKCHLITATGYDEAMDVMSKQLFDIVLTDLHLPMSPKGMGNKFRLGELVPYGLLLLLEAGRQGARYVAVVTDLSHHDDPFSSAFDHFTQYAFTVEGAISLMIHAKLKPDGAKDWLDAFNGVFSIDTID